MQRVIFFAFFLCPVLLASQDAASDYIVKDKVLVKYQGTSRTVVIPPNLGINRIGVRAFAGAPISSVVIPMGVAYIDERAFMGCSFLKEVRLPNTIITLGRRAFFNCYLLETINIPISIVTIEEGAFFNCSNLKQINLPDTLKNLGARAFSGCLSMEHLSVSRRTKIGSYAFMGVPPTALIYKD